jgi:fermentation-respiration switch protein FrsA (DUF1100 family)
LSGCGREAIINRMAFSPTVTKADVLQNIPPDVSEVYIDTADNLRLQSFFISNSSSSGIVIYFHGNAGNIYERIPELINLSKTGVSVLGIGYRGYGKSTGKPSERGIYLDGQAALKYAKEILNYRKDKIFLCGRSLGSVVALEMARHNNYAGVILITPLTSGREILKAHGYRLSPLLVGDVIDNMKKVPDISSPVLIIHGDKDEVVPWEMGEKIFSALKNYKQIITIIGGRHSDLEFVNPALYYSSIEQFINAPTNE